MYEITRPEWLGLFGEIYLTTIIMVLILFGVFYQSESTLGIQPKKPIGIYTTAGLAIQTLFITGLLFFNEIPIDGLTIFVHDSLGHLVSILLMISVALFLFIIIPLIQQDSIYTFEYIVLILCSVLGMLLLVKSNDLISMYLSIVPI